jgi:Protein of unknown function (DUF1367)
MSHITIAKTSDDALTQEQLRVLRTVLFDTMDGVTDVDKRAWRMVWNTLTAAGSGELFSLDIQIQRDPVFHRAHMKLETAMFHSQEQFLSFEQFRNWLKAGAGFVDWIVINDGTMVARPKSIAYAACDEPTMRQFHADAIAFLRTPRAYKTLWPAMLDAQAESMIETFLARFQA